MEKQKRKAHWEKVYEASRTDSVGWFQQVPETSLDLIGRLDLDPGAKIMDAGGGDSALAGHLLDRGFDDLTVLDISSAAIARAKGRLGDKATPINWVNTDILDYKTGQMFDLWHDRAAFHFLTYKADIDKYIRIVTNAIRPGGFLIIGTFSDTGPTKCSGLEITQYSTDSLIQRFSGAFRKVVCVNPDHITPGGVVQHYTFCCFQKRASF